jgi:hypothetical protein
VTISRVPLHNYPNVMSKFLFNASILVSKGHLNLFNASILVITDLKIEFIELICLL